MNTLDRRLHAFRPDLADSRLRETVTAERYADPRPARIATGHAPLRARPDIACSLDTELLYGETVEVFERRDGWAWVQSRTDGYVGYLREDVLDDRIYEATHRVAALRTYLYPEPDLKSPPLHLISMNAPLAVTETERSGFLLLAEGGWVHRRHIAPVGYNEVDHCAVALRFIGTPYLWGGRTSLGLDCSALVQMSLMRCGIDVPRDSDMQEQNIGREAICERDMSDLRRGDIVYWKGHCGIWIDQSAFIHANATDMAVAIQPLRRILAQVAEATGDDQPRIRRP
jgi:cell wall-associated NlpC family hydrolase